MINFSAEEFYFKAQKWSRSKKSQLKDDFPAFAVEWFLKKERNGYDFEWLWIDFLRETNGDFRSSCHRNRKFIEYEEFRSSSDCSIQLEGNSIIDLDDAGITLNIIKSMVKKREYYIFLLSFFYEQQSIAAMLGVTPSAISRVITKVKKYNEIARAIIERKYERDFDIQWIEI